VGRVTEVSAATTASPAPGEAADTRAFRFEVLIVVLLGIVSVATAWVTFQAALYDGQQAAAYAAGQKAQTEAESLYLEANQQFIQDTQTVSRLDELTIARESADPAAADVAAQTYDYVMFASVSEDLRGALERAAAANEADPDTYTDPLADETYQQALFGPWQETSALAAETVAKGDVYNGYGDRLTLGATLMAMTLFLLGVAAVVRRQRTKTVLIVLGMAIFVVAAVLGALVPITWL